MRSEREVGWGTPELNARGECVSPRKRRYSEKREAPGFSHGECQEVGYLAESEDCRDFDLAAKQPEDLMDFFEGFFKFGRFVTIQDYYHTVYAKGVS